MRRAKTSILFLNFLISFFHLPLLAQPASESMRTALASVSPRDRVVQPVDNNARVALDGNTLPQALPAYETGPAEPNRALEHILLTLKPDAAQQSALDALTQAQQDPESPLYHQWLTPELYGAHFGVSNRDIEQVGAWLESFGLKVDEVAPSRRTLLFSGTVEQVEAAFQTTIHSYRFAGQPHIANDSDPQIPAALAGVIDGVSPLNDLFSAPQHRAVKLSPEFTSGSAHYLSPSDFAVIYDAAGLYRQAYTGIGGAVAILGRSDINLADIRTFRSQFSLPAKDPVIIINGANPGTSSQGDLDESTLDVEWSGGVANGATIDFVTSSSTAVSDGVSLSAQYAVNHNVAPVISLSYGLCESSLGVGGNSFWNALWQQAAAEGITVLVSAGDSGAAGCDASSATKATQGRGVNGICSSPYSTCVGGTEFSEGSNSSQYWGNTNSTSGESALSYIPEVVWNESGSGGLWSTGGGISNVYAKPSWQTGSGVPADGQRDVPDVAMAAAGHDAYLVQVSGALYGFSGTSAAAPSFAGLLALVEQKAGSRLGNANPQLYKLAAEGCCFHDITSGNNSVPGVTGFNAGTGYDQTTGLGSVDAEKLAMAWPGAQSAPAPKPAFTVSVPAPAIVLGSTRSGTTVVSTAISGGFSAPIALKAGGLPSGVSATFTPATIPSPGAGSSKLTLTAAAAQAPGTYPFTLTATGAGISEAVSMTAYVPGLALTATPQSTTLLRGSTLTVNLTTAAEGGFNSALSFAISGLPSGVKGAFSPTALAAPGSGKVVLTLSATTAATLGAAKIQVTVSGSGFSAVATIPITMAATSANGGRHVL